MSSQSNTANPSDLTHRALFVIRGLLRVGSALHRNGDRIAGEYGLNQQQFVVLSEIVERGPINQKQIIGGLLIEKSNLSKIAKKLRARGLVRISPSPDDGRATLLTATPQGECVWRDCMEEFSRWGAEWLGSLTDEELTGTMEVLERLKALPL